MASTYSTDLSLELVTTGEKAGLWGTITNTNLQLLQTSSFRLCRSNFKYRYNVTLRFIRWFMQPRMVKTFTLKLLGTLSGNASLTMPASTTGGNANRVFFVEDGTTRGGAGDSHGQ